MKEFWLDKKKCTGCSACFNSCNTGAIQMVPDECGFIYPKILNSCVNCGLCENICKNRYHIVKANIKNVYAAWSKNNDIRFESTSGGLFSELVSPVLDNGGYVFGAAYDNDMSIHHICVSSLEDLHAIRQSKYSQSNVDSIFKDIKSLLLNSKIVVFCGSPCQVAGLRSYLGKDYDNLICIDLIRHGVPSPEVFARYLLEKGGEHKVTAMSFRNKHPESRSSTLDYWLDNGEKISESYEESPYIKGFIQNLYVRPSCFQCKYKGIERCSDITIGDFWGIDEFHPGFSDDKGTSAIIVHSEKGIQMFEKIKDQLAYVEATSHEVGAWNSCIYRPVEKNIRRKEFFEKWNHETISEAVLELEVLNKNNGQSTKKVNSLLEKLKRVLIRKLNGIL